MSVDSANCVFCGQSSNLLCQRCFESYCSVQCQISDWSKHKLICMPLPQLIPKNDFNIAKQQPLAFATHYNTKSETVPIENLAHLVKQNCQQQTASNGDTRRFRSLATNLPPMRRPRIPSFNSNIEQRLNFMDQNDYNEKNLFRTKSRPGKSVKNNDELDFSVDTAFSFSTANISDNFEKKLNLVAAIDTKGVLNNVEANNSKQQAWKTPFEMPKDKFFNAVVQYYDSTKKVAWLTVCSLVEGQIALLREINSNLNNMTQATKKDICKGSLYAVQFEDLYYRGICLKEVNALNQVKVRLIDFGNVLSMDYHKLKLPLTFMKNLNAFAFGIYYPNIIDEDKKIKIQILKKISDPIIGDVFLVEEEINGEIIKFKPIDEPIKDFSTPKNNVSKFLSHDFDLKLINFIDNSLKKTAVVQILHNDVKIELSNMNELLNSEKTFKYDLINTPKKGHFIVGRCGKFWKRGIVVGKFDKEFLIFFTDFGEIAFVEQVKEIPADYKSLANQIALINIDEILINTAEFYNKYFIVNNKLSIKNLNNQDLTAKCHLVDKAEKLAFVTLKNFEGNLIEVMQNNLWYVSPGHKNTVRITNVIDHCTIHITIDSIYDSYRMKINAIGETLEEESKLLQKNPTLEINSIVLAKTGSSEYIRCRIVDVKHGECDVEDIDSGKVVSIKNDSIFAANDLLKLMPVCTAKYTMSILNKLMPHTKLNKSLQQLKLYSEQNEKFILISENSFDGIELSPVDNESQPINTLLIPLLFQDMDSDQDLKKSSIDITEESNVKSINIVSNIAEVKLDEGKYFLKDIEVEPIICGENVELLILDNSELKKGYITASIKDLKFIEKVFGDYQDLINKYCTDPKNGNDYLPEVNELCLAIFDEDDLWYRAFCIETNEKDEAKLIFLDFGNIILATRDKIRRFDKTFLYKRLANTCFIQDFPSSPGQKKIDYLATNIFKANSIVTVDSVKAIGHCEYAFKLDGMEKYFSNN